MCIIYISMIQVQGIITWHESNLFPSRFAILYNQFLRYDQLNLRYSFEQSPCLLPKLTNSLTLREFSNQLMKGADQQSGSSLGLAVMKIPKCTKGRGRKVLQSSNSDTFLVLQGGRKNRRHPQKKKKKKTEDLRNGGNREN